MPIRYSKPDKQPPGREEFAVWFERDAPHFPDEQIEEAWAYIAEHTPYLDYALFLRYQTHREDRVNRKKSPEHFAPGYHSPERYKRLYIRSPVEFWKMVNHRRAMRERTTEQREAEQLKRDQDRQAKREEKERQRQEQEQQYQERIANIRLWHKQGLSMNQMCKRLRGHRSSMLALIKSVIEEGGTA